MTEIKLATYGTLAPGRANHHQLEGIEGSWQHGFVRGNLVPEGWGSVMGFPGLVLDAEASEVPVEIFTSTALGEHLARLDAFEGEGYRRVETQVATPEGTVLAFIYVLAQQQISN